MERNDAVALVKLLADAFLKQLEPGTTEVYVAAFEKLRSKSVAFETVKVMIDNSERFPSIATIRATYIRKRNAQLDHEQLLQIEQGGGNAGEIPPVTRELIDKMRSRSAEAFHPESSLEEREGGTCDDCVRNFDRRFVYGSFVLCASCAAKRAVLRKETA